MLLHCSPVLRVCANSSGVCLSISVWKTSLNGIPRALESLWTYAPKETWEGAILGDLALIWLLGKSPAFVWKYSEWLLQSEWGLQVTVWIKWRGFFFFLMLKMKLSLSAIIKLGRANQAAEQWQWFFATTWTLRYTVKITEACLQIKYMQIFLSGTYVPGDLHLHLLFQIKPVSDSKPTLFFINTNVRYQTIF